MAQDNAVLERTLPHNLEAERTVLGAILIENETFHHAAEILTPRDFYRDAHRKVFARMAVLSERGHAIDLVTLKEEMSRAGELDSVGGVAYLGSLLEGVPRATNVSYYSRIVKDKSVLRSLISAANRISQACFDNADESQVVLDEAEKSIFEISEGAIRSGFEPVSEIVKGSFKTIDALSENRELVTGVPTGFVEFDEMTSGLQPSDLIIVAARPAMGKTSFCMNIAQHVGLKTDGVVGVFSLEMSKEQLVLRMLCGEARVNMHKLRSGFLSEKDWTKLVQAVSDLSQGKIFIDDTPSISIMEMRAKARRLKLEQGLDLLIVDYLQLMQGRGRFENRTQEIANISRSLKALAKELDIPVVALSQLSRAPESRGDHRPQLSDLRESGALEQDADVVVFIYREEEYNQTPDNRGISELIIGKQRNGPTGTVKMAFIKEYTRFENLEWRHDDAL
ncbi:MAG TPA: replicative DNA helicase [Vicinamibacteria bacterium]|nr:replicative DNA helicase [Vicinamibacteria bacterium]